jgi:hypothetical protein
LSVVRQFTPNQIRAQVLANLHRWRRHGAWVSAHDEWQAIAERGEMASFLRRRLAATTMRQGCASRSRSSACCRRRRCGDSMKKRQVDHVLRAAGRVTGEKQFVIIGSQPLHGKYPDMADQIVMSAGVDLIAAENPQLTELERDLVRGLVSRDRLLALLDQTPVTAAIRERIRAGIASDFGSPATTRRSGDRAGRRPSLGRRG